MIASSREGEILDVMALRRGVSDADAHFITRAHNDWFPELLDEVENSNTLWRQALSILSETESKIGTLFLISGNWST